MSGLFLCVGAPRWGALWEIVFCTPSRWDRIRYHGSGILSSKNRKVSTALIAPSRLELREQQLVLRTICIQDRRPLFGTLDSEGDAHLSAIGRIVHEEWMKTAAVRSYVELDEFCIMPDHFHGILIIENDGAPEDIAKKEHWQKGCLGSIINQFKGVCTKRIQKINPSFSWQRNFHDHIIRNQKDLERIRGYIRENPQAKVFGNQL